MNAEQITYVTGLWDIGRDDRDFQSHYLKKFEELLTVNVPMVIFGPPQLRSWVEARRHGKSTVYNDVSLDDIKTQTAFFWEQVQGIRTNSDWRNQATWLAQSPQANLKYYNPIVFNKFFWLSSVSRENPFCSEQFFWIDAGITNTVPGDLLVTALGTSHYQGFTLLCYEHKHDNEIHGFPRSAMNHYCQSEAVNWVSRGGFFGGDAYHIDILHGLYYYLLLDTLNSGLMGTEESLFTILAHTRPDLISSFELPSGMITPYFESLANRVSPDRIETYIQTYNTPGQLRLLLESFRRVEPALLSKTTVIVQDNSDDPGFEQDYRIIDQDYPSIKRVKKDNPGITGGRVEIAKQFAASNADYYLFFEDDMLLWSEAHSDRSQDVLGFNRAVPNLLDRLVAVADTSKLDFIKLNFQEIFATNTFNTTWHNTPKSMRGELWRQANNPAQTEFKSIESITGLAYASGDVFYANWPHVMSRRGNQKIFIEPELDRISEGELMLHCHHLNREATIRSGVLLASPIHHERTFFYQREKRKEA